MQAMAVLGACAAPSQGSPVEPTPELPNVSATEDPDDPLAHVDRSPAAKEVQGPTGYDACQTFETTELIVIDGTVGEVGQAVEFEGCERNIATPVAVTVHGVEEGDVGGATSITIWQEGGRIVRADGSRASAFSTRSCGKLPPLGTRGKLCIQHAGPDFVTRCCPGRG